MSADLLETTIGGVTTPSTSWKETIPEGESEALEALAEQLRELQRGQAKKGRAVGRALHLKPHAGVEATLEVLEDLPAHAAHGLFASPGKYDCYVRFSNGSGRWQSDRQGDVRGIAVKVLGVEGKKIIPGLEDAKTQDFLLIQSSATPFRNAEEFVALVVAASGSPLLLVPRFAGKVGWGRAFGLVKKLLAGINAPFTTFAGRTLYSALPIQCGPYAARLSLIPRGEVGAAPTASGENALADDLAARLAEGPLAWDLALQFFVDEARTPIEDASVDWTDSPYVAVARLEIPRQDVGSERGQKVRELVETLSFDPWHALVEHRPLGNMMRARNHAYRLSTKERGAAPEPEGLAAL